MNSFLDSKPWFIAWVFANLVVVFAVPELFKGGDPVLPVDMDAAFFVVLAICWGLVAVAMWFALKGIYERRK
jgi:hypothetical protein